VFIPAGNYVSGPIELVSNLTLHIDAGATVRFLAARLPFTEGRQQSIEALTPVPLIGGRHLENVAITGRGVLASDNAEWMKLMPRQKASGGDAGSANGPNWERLLQLLEIQTPAPREAYLAAVPAGTTDWNEYSIFVPLQPNARQLYIGFLLAGTGKAWADDLQLLVDGKPIWEAPKAERPKTIIDTDHEFDNGSKVIMTELSKVQIENLASLGKIWGFLKYHHPEIAAGRRHWDYDLFRILPAVLKAPDREAANAAVTTWIARLGDVPACQSCARLDEAELHLKPEIEWIKSEAMLGGDLSRALQAVYRNRSNGKQFYLSLTPGVGNPVFQNEPGYGAVNLPDPGFQLLALYRFWNIIEYWFPYRDVIGEDWDKVLVEFIPKVVLAKTSDDYKHEMMALIARVHDTHANLWSSLNVRPPVGTCQLPVIVRFLENRAVVTGYTDAGAAVGMPLKRGDVIEALDGVAVSDLIRQWKPYYAASNEPTVLRDMARELTRGACGEVKVHVRRENGTLEVAANRLSVIRTSSDGKCDPRSSGRHIPATFQRHRVPKAVFHQSRGLAKIRR
jgi:hypothetical protein